MIVLDTSAALELLLSLPLAGKVQQHLDVADWQIAAPQLLIVEVLQVLRRRTAAGLTSTDDANEALELLRDLNIHYFDHDLLADRVWELRENLTAYDASYVALAEMLNADLITADAKMASAPGNRAGILLIE